MKQRPGRGKPQHQHRQSPNGVNAWDVYRTTAPATSEPKTRGDDAARLNAGDTKYRPGGKGC